MLEEAPQELEVEEDVKGVFEFEPDVTPEVDVRTSELGEADRPRMPAQEEKLTSGSRGGIPKTSLDLSNSAKVSMPGDAIEDDADSDRAIKI